MFAAKPVTGRQQRLRRAGHAAISIVALTLAFPAWAANLTGGNTGDVAQIIGQAVVEANARGIKATIAVVDRTGNVLGVYKMTGATNPIIAHNPRGPDNGLNGATVPAEAAAIAKAVTAAFLSTTGGNAFTTRTASQIIQDHFNPGVANAPSGPLYGVQFSQLPCSDVNQRVAVADNGSTPGPGPKRSPLGLAGDPGGIPLYKSGELVGAIGAIGDGLYGLDTNVNVNDHSTDEAIALAGTIGYDTPAAIRADRITAGGVLLRYTDVIPGNLLTKPFPAGSYATLFAAAGPTGMLSSVTGYYNAANGLRTGTTYGTTASGLLADTAATLKQYPQLDGLGSDTPLLLVNNAGAPRFPLTTVTGAAPAGTTGITPVEASSILVNTYQLIRTVRAQIRQPSGTTAAVTVMVTDVNGKILGELTRPDAPIFGIDVSVQKARTTVFMSGRTATPALSVSSTFTPYLAQAKSFFGANALNGTIAYSAQAVGNLERDSYPDGIDGTINGPFALPLVLSTPFADGLQESLIQADLLTHLAFVQNMGADVAAMCTTGLGAAGQGVTGVPAVANGIPVLQNGLQIFPGGFPIYRNNVLVGGIGISGDGVTQDDLIGFLGLYNGTVNLHTGLGHAPLQMRISNYTAHSVAPRYVTCPNQPLVTTNSQNVCAGK